MKHIAGKYLPVSFVHFSFVFLLDFMTYLHDLNVCPLAVICVANISSFVSYFFSLLIMSFDEQGSYFNSVKFVSLL